MSRFTTVASAPAVPSPDARTHEGGDAATLTPQLEAFLLGTTFLTGSFYETGDARVQRYGALIAKLSTEDPNWVAQFLPWLRSVANIRTAAVVGAVEAARNGLGRQILGSVLLRADEPAEALGYHFAVHGKRLPAAVKRGIADAATKLYTERAAVKYAARGAGVQPGDVIDLTHPTPGSAAQGAVFRYLLDVRHGRSDPRFEGLDLIAGVRSWLEAPTVERLPRGLTWESALSRGVDSGIERRALWERLIDEDSLGYMALIRNLRNMEEADVSPAHQKLVSARIVERVGESRVMPWRLQSAYTATRVFGGPLREATETAIGNVPVYPGRTLVMVDTSASMNSVGWNNANAPKSAVNPVNIAAFYAAALSTKGDSEVVIYADRPGHLDKTAMPANPMARAEAIVATIGRVGHGTATWPSTRSALERLGRFDRIVVLTDMQDAPDARKSAGLPSVPIYVFDLAGYGKANLRPGPGRYLFSGVTDTQFGMPPVLEAAEGNRWPWQ
jgi:hypothetical protein